MPSRKSGEEVSVCDEIWSAEATPVFWMVLLGGGDWAGGEEVAMDVWSDGEAFGSVDEEEEAEAEDEGSSAATF